MRLIRKRADRFNGVDLAKHQTEDVLELADRDGQILLVAGWAEVTDDPPESRQRDRPKSEKRGSATALVLRSARACPWGLILQPVTHASADYQAGNRSY